MPGDFLDTNVLIYLASSDPAKAWRAEALIDAGGIISVQVLNEIANVGRRKMRLTWSETRDFLAAVRGLLDLRDVTVEVHETGLDLAERHRLSIYDAMIAAAAPCSPGCPTPWRAPRDSRVCQSRQVC